MNLPNGGFFIGLAILIIIVFVVWQVTAAEMDIFNFLKSIFDGIGNFGTSLANSLFGS